MCAVEVPALWQCWISTVTGFSKSVRAGYPVDATYTFCVLWEQKLPRERLWCAMMSTRHSFTPGGRASSGKWISKQNLLQLKRWSLPVYMKETPMQLLPLEVKPHPMETVYSCVHCTHIDWVCAFCTGPRNLITWQVWCWLTWPRF